MLDQRIDLLEGHAKGTEQVDPETSLREASLLLQQSKNVLKYLVTKPRIANATESREQLKNESIGFKILVANVAKFHRSLSVCNNSRSQSANM